MDYSGVDRGFIVFSLENDQRPKRWLNVLIILIVAVHDKRLFIMMPKEIILEEEEGEVKSSNIVELAMESSMINTSRSSPSSDLYVEAAEPPPELRSTKPKKRRKSEIWNHFIKVDQDKGARCNYCSHILSFAAGSLSNLLRHLRKKHPSAVVGFRYSTGITYDSKSMADLLETEGANEVRVISDGKPLSNCEQLKASSSQLSIESDFKRDHAYGGTSLPRKEDLFSQFIQSELNKFKNELLLRQCKREILKTLMKFQQAEDELNSQLETSITLND